jgi:hypothetical protein
MERMSRKAQLAEWREAQAKFEKDIEGNAFLKVWLANNIEGRRQIEAETNGLTASERAAYALERGCRTWAALIAGVEACDQLFHSYVYSPAFADLWAFLKELDRRGGSIELFCPANGAVPARLIEAVVEWHRLPKFTKTEHKRHCDRIAVLCDELQILLGQLSPASYPDPFEFLPIGSEQASKITTMIGVRSVPSQDAPPWREKRRLQHILKAAGIDFRWTVSALREQSKVDTSSRFTPTKIRSKSAYKTFLIRHLDSAIDPFLISRPIRGLHQIVADVVGEITRQDCSAEDVRKALASRGSED